MRLGVAAALVDGEMVGGDVEVVDGQVAAVGLGTPGGSRIALGVPLAAALPAATEAPARMARRSDLGRLAPGTVADLVVLDDSLQLQQVLLAGRPA